MLLTNLQGAMLGVRLLGQFEIVRGGQVLYIKSRPAQSLLAYLLLNHQTKYRREALAGALWPEVSEVSARNNLRQLLWQIKKSLGVDLVVSDRISVGINPMLDFKLDTRQFESGLDEAINLHQRLENLELYKGELLPGFYDDWVADERERFGRLFDQHMRMAIEALEKDGNWREVGHLAERWCTRRKGCEPAYRARIQAYVSLGDAASAVAVYQRYAEELEDELGIKPSIDMQTLLERIAKEQWVPPGRSPYRGLFAFREEDSPFFFGREFFVSRLMEKLAQNKIVALSGPSGIGKTSTVFAGLIPAFKQQKWKVVSLRPGSDPISALSSALAVPEIKSKVKENKRSTQPLEAKSNQLRVSELLALLESRGSNGTRQLIAIDQFEETYTLCTDDERRENFIQLLLDLITAVSKAKKNVALLLSVRADFLGQVLESRLMAEALEDAIVSLGPMNPEELYRAIRHPAEKSGAGFEPGLIERITDDIGEKANLPLLEFALSELWNRRQERLLTHKVYEALGKVRGALAGYAEDAFRGLSVGEQEQARKIFIQLVQPGEETADTKRISTRDQLGETAWPLALALADHRLLIVDRNAHDVETAELVHEALMTEWDRFRYWIDSGRQFRQWQELLRGNLAQWRKSGRDAGALLRGAPLAEAQLHLREQVGLVAAEEREFIERSLEVQNQASLEKDKTRRRIQVGLISGIVVALTLAAAAGVSFLNASREQRAAVEAYSLGLAANAQQLLAGHDPVTALPLALAANQIENPPWQAQNILREVVAAPGARRVIWQPPEVTTGFTIIGAVAYTPDGKYLLMNADAQGTILLLDISTGEVVKEFLGHTAFVDEIEISPDGRLAASAADDGSWIIWDMATGQALHQLNAGVLFGLAVDFGPDGSWIIGGGPVAGNDVVTVSTTPGIIVQWDTHTGEEIKRFEGGHKEIVLDVEVSPDGRTMLSSAGLRKTYDLIPEQSNVVLWDVATGEILHDFAGEIHSSTRLAYSPDGKYGLVGSMEGVPYLLNLEDYSVETFPEHSSWVAMVAFSRDGKRIIVGTGDGKIYIWDRDGHELLYLYSIHTDEITNLEVHPLNGTFVSGSFDGKLIEWDLYDADQVTTFSSHTAAVNSAVFSPDGKLILSGSNDNSVRLWDAETGELLNVFRGHTASVREVAFSPNGEYALSASEDNTLRLWSITNRRFVRRLEGHHGAVNGLAFLPDGTRAISVSTDLTAILWNVETGEIIQRLSGFHVPVFSVAVNSSGEWALISSAYDLMLWDLETGQPVKTFKTLNTLYSIDSLVLSANERLAFSSSASFTTSLSIWDLDSLSEVQRLTTLGSNYSIDVTEDAKFALVASSAKNLELYDLSTGDVIRSYAGHGDGALLSASFSPDEQYALSAGEDGVIIKWRMRYPQQEDLFAWVEANRYVRELSCNERALYRVEPLCVKDEAVLVAPQLPEDESWTLSYAPPDYGEHYAVMGENRGDLQLYTYDLWLYRGTAGESINIYARADNPRNATSPDEGVALGLLDTVLIIINPDGTLLEANNIGVIGGLSGGTDAGIEGLVLPMDGVYRIQVQSSQGQMGGGYTLILEHARQGN